MSLSSVYLITPKSYNLYLKTEDFKKIHAYFFTFKYKEGYIITEDFKKKAAYVLTSSLLSKYLFTEDYDKIDPLEQTCRYPTQLDYIRDLAVKLYHKEIEELLKSSIYSESYGKVSQGGYIKTGMMRILIDYLSSIWIQKDYDSRSGLARTADYYWTTYQIYDVISNFRECNLNIKPIVALFNLNSYTVIDDEWPNYFMMDKVINPPDEDKQKEMKQWTDIYTLQPVTPDRNQSIKPLSSSQTSFLPTKIIKYFSAFTINGVDYTGYTDYNANSVTYSPSQLFGYNIEDNDTVIITYWYEE